MYSMIWGALIVALVILLALVADTHVGVSKVFASAA